MENSISSTNLKSILLIAAVLMLMSIVNVSHATTVLSFTNIENNTVDISDQLSVEVTDTSAGVTFKFLNNVGITSSVTDIYFDEGEADLFSGFQIIDSSGANFEPTAITDSAATPGNLPGWENVSFSADYSADTSGNPENGIDTSTDFVTFLALAGNDFSSYNDLISSLLSGAARIGLHIQAYGDGKSDSYVNTVPVPAAAWLFGTALLGFFATSKRRKN